MTLQTSMNVMIGTVTVSTTVWTQMAATTAPAEKASRWKSLDMTAEVCWTLHQLFNIEDQSYKTVCT